MQEGTFQTGSDISSNAGNAALGYGGYGVAYDGGATDPLSGIDKTMSQLQQEDLHWNMQRYHQKILDRDALYDEISKGTDFTGNMPNGAKGPNGEPISFGLLEPDQQVLREKADKIKDIMVKNPNIKTDRAKNGELQQELNDFQRLRFNAQARAVEAARQRHDLVNEQDQDERVKRQDHLASELGNGIEHVPYPYMKPLSFDDNILSPDVKAESSGTPRFEQDANGMWHQIDKMATPMSGFINGGKYVPGSPYFTNANNKYQRAVESPSFMKPENIELVNKRIAAINEAEGLTPDALNYIQPIANIGEDGKVVPNTNVPQFVRSMHMAQKYKAYDDVTLSKDAQNMQKTLSEQKQHEATASKERSIADLNRAKKPVQDALANKYNAEADLARSKGNQIDVKEAQAKSDAIGPVTEAFGVYDKYLNELNFQSAPELRANMSEREAKAFNKYLSGNPDAQVAVVPNRNDAIVSILSMPDYGEKKNIGDKAPDGKLKGIKKPRFVYMVKPDKDEDARFIGVFDNGDIVSVDRVEAVDRMIDYKSKFAGGAAMVKLKNASHAVMKDYQSAYSNVAKSAPSEASAPPSEAKVATPATPSANSISMAYIPGQTKARKNASGDVEVFDPNSNKWRKLLSRDENNNLTLE